MKRASLLALLALAAALFGGSVIVVLLVAGEAPPASSPPVPRADAPPPSPSLVATPLPSRAPPDAGPMRMRASSWNGPAGGPSASPMASRVVRKIVRKALLAAQVQSQLARCADSVGGFGGRTPGGPAPRGKPAVLLLELTGEGGEVRIVDAQVQEWGGASEAAVSCARGVLTGRVVRAPTAPRERMRMPFPLNPRSEVVASSR